MLRARVTAQLSGQSSRLKPIAADERMTQPVGVNRDGTLSTYPPVYPVLTVNGKTGEVRLAAKDVGALPAETRIPQNTSDLNNDSGFIGRLVEDLENYYRKSETYTREEIDYRISLIPKFKISVVEALPTENISGTTVYLLKAGNTSGDLYTEYIFTGGAWEILGSQRVDLTGYAKETWVSDLLKGYAKQTEFDALAGKAEETASRTIPTYVLSEGETPEDAPEWAEEVIDPYNDPEGGGYVLTEDDKQEIAEIAAGMVDVPEGGGGSGEWEVVGKMSTDVDVLQMQFTEPPDGRDFADYSEFVILWFLTPNSAGLSGQGTTVAWDLKGLGGKPSNNAWSSAKSVKIPEFKLIAGESDIGQAVYVHLKIVADRMGLVEYMKTNNTSSINNMLQPKDLGIGGGLTLNYPSNGKPTTIETALPDATVTGFTVGSHVAGVGAGSMAIVYGKLK